MRIKFCGMTRAQDIQLAATLGVDAIGLVFYENSRRVISADQAQQLLAQTPAFMTTVGLWVDPTVQQVEAVLAQCPFDLLQFHGAESPEFCRQFARPYIKALRIQPGVDIIAACEAYDDAKALLLDSYHPQQVGGTGQAFNWDLIPQHCPKPIILAGGLRADNVAQARRQVNPYAIDVSSGIECEPGIKDAGKMQALINEVNGDNGSI